MVTYRVNNCSFQFECEAARYLADRLLPDPAVIDRDEDAATVADEMIVFWTAEAAKVGERLAGDAVEAERHGCELPSTAAVRRAIVKLIERSRGAGGGLG